MAALWLMTSAVPDGRRADTRGGWGATGARGGGEVVGEPRVIGDEVRPPRRFRPVPTGRAPGRRSSGRRRGARWADRARGRRRSRGRRGGGRARRQPPATRRG